MESSSKFNYADRYAIKTKNRVDEHSDVYGIFTVKFHPNANSNNGYLLAAIGHPFVKLFMVVDGKFKEISSFDYDEEKESFYSLTWCSSVRTEEYDIVALAGNSGNIVCFHPYPDVWSFNLPAHHLEVSQLITHPSKSHIIASSSYDDSITLWNVATKVLIAKFHGLYPQQGIYDLQFRPNGNAIISADGGHRICVWSLKSKRIKKMIKKSEKKMLENDPLITIDAPSKTTTEIHLKTEIDSLFYLFDDFFVSRSAANDVICWKFGEKLPKLGDKKNVAINDPVKIMKRIREPTPSKENHRTWFRFAIDRKNLLLAFNSMKMGTFCSFNFANQDEGVTENVFPQMKSIVRFFDFSPDGKFLVAGTPSRELFLFTPKS